MLYDVLQSYFKESEMLGWFVEICKMLQNKKDELILDAQLQLNLDFDLSNQWRSKGGKWGHAPWGAGLGGAPVYFLQSFKTVF